MVEAGRGGGGDAPVSPVSRAGGGIDVPGAGSEGSRGRFATDFEVMEVIGAGTFGTVYKVRFTSKYTPGDIIQQIPIFFLQQYLGGLFMYNCFLSDDFLCDFFAGMYFLASTRKLGTMLGLMADRTLIAD